MTRITNNSKDLQNFPRSLQAFTAALTSQWENHAGSFAGVVVALSGGLDSSTLLRVFCTLPNRIPLVALHVNYGLRGAESEADAHFCQQICHNLNIPIKVIKAPKPPTSGVQEWARDFRYEALKAEAGKSHLIALAHHLDDLAETVMFRLIRGASPGNLLGMKEFQGSLWRPFINLDRATISHWSKQLRWDHRDDSSNAKMEYSRNFIRHEILPRMTKLHPGVATRLVALARQAYDLEEFSAGQLAFHIDSSNSVDAQWLTEQSDGVAFQVLRLMLRNCAASIEESAINRRLWSQIWQQLLRGKYSQNSWCFDLPAGLLCEFDRGRLRIRKAQTKQKQNRADQHRRNLTQRSASALLPPKCTWRTNFKGDPNSLLEARNDSSLTKILGIFEDS